MIRDWKPGDVALATVRGVPNVRVMAGEGTADPKLRWLTTDNRVYRLQVALREFADTEPEPTDPKVRVTDRRDNIWRLLADGDWVCTSGPDIGEYLTWSRLAAERGPLDVDR